MRGEQDVIPRTRSTTDIVWGSARGASTIFFSLLFHLALHRSDLEIAWMLAPSNGESRSDLPPMLFHVKI
jgi:hypothetical protein